MTHLIAYVAGMGVALLLVWPYQPRDDTDPPSGRSGMGLHTDARTGCQYLSRAGLTPRLDATGKHICEARP